jgi:hypothetical protein
MPLSQKLGDELQEILIEDFGKNLDKKRIFELGNTLILYFDILAKIYLREELKDRKNERIKH